MLAILGGQRRNSVYENILEASLLGSHPYIYENAETNELG